MRRARFVGGPLHGEIRALPDSHQYLQAPVFNDVTAWGSEKIEKFSPGLSTVTYERRQLALGPWARVELWTPSGMSEPEFMRRVADILEGVGEPLNKR